MPTNTSPRIGIVGLGNIGHVHAERLVESDATLVGGVDIDSNARVRFSERFGVETDEKPDRLFDAADAVIVATPNQYHEPYAVGALDAGLDVLIEKPLAHTVESAERIARRARTADGFCMVGFSNRFSNPVRVVSGLENYRLGRIQHIEANYVRRRGIPGCESWFTNGTAAGGGALIDIGVHAIDLALSFLGFPDLVEVSGTTRSQFGARTDDSSSEAVAERSDLDEFAVEDSASAFVRCADGRTISLETAWATNRSPNHTFVLRGTEGGVRFTLDRDTVTLYENGQGKTSLRSGASSAYSVDSLAAEQNTFVRGVIEDERPTRNTVEQALSVQRVVEAIYRSAETGRAVRVGEQMPPSVSDDAGAAGGSPAGSE